MGGGKSLKIRKLKGNVGVGAVRDIGIGMATGKYIMFVDPDDYVHPQILETCVNAMEEHQCQLVQVNFTRTSKSISDFKDVNNPIIKVVEGLNIEELADHVCWGKLYQTSLIKGHALKMKYRSFEDTAFTRAYSLLCNRAVFVNETLYYYYANPTSNTAKMSMSKIKQSIERTNDVIEVYKSHDLAEKAERYRLSSQTVLIRNLMRMDRKEQLKLCEEVKVKNDTRKIISLFNRHRLSFIAYACYRLGAKYTIKYTLRKLKLMK